MSILGNISEHIHPEKMPGKQSSHSLGGRTFQDIDTRTAQMKLEKYTHLYKRFKSGEKLSANEVHLMTKLSDELKKFTKQ